MKLAMATPMVVRTCPGHRSSYTGHAVTAASPCPRQVHNKTQLLRMVVWAKGLLGLLMREGARIEMQA
jgi:hypothetical protein